MTPDPQAQRLTEALRRESPDLLRYFRRRVTEPEDAADLLAETGLTAWRRVRDLPADDELSLIHILCRTRAPWRVQRAGRAALSRP